MIGTVRLLQEDKLVLEKKNNIASIATFYIASSMGFFPEQNYLLNQIIITYNNGGGDLFYTIPITTYYNAGDEFADFQAEIPLDSFTGTMTQFLIQNSNLQEAFSTLDVPDITKALNQSFVLEWKFKFS